MEKIVSISEKKSEFLRTDFLKTDFLRIDLLNAFFSAESVEVALEQTLRIIVNATDWSIGHVYRFAPNDKVLISTRIVYSQTDDSIHQTIQNICKENPARIFPFGDKRQGIEVIFISDNDELQMDSRYHFFMDRGFQTTCRIPLVVNGHVRYVVEFFATATEFSDKLLLDILSETKHNLEKVMERILNARHLQKLSQAVDASPVSVLICDKNGTIEFANPEFCKTTGYDLTEVIGASTNLTNSNIHSSVFFRKLWSEILQGNNWRGEICNKKKSGDLFWETVIISPVRNHDDAITHFVAIKEDITEKKKFETELKAAKEAAISSDRAKSQFVANMSHEIRTPLNAITGLSHLLLRSRLPAKQRRKVKQIASSAEGLLEVINTILDFSKMEAGKIELEMVDFELSSILDDVGVIIGQRARQKNVEFIIDMSPDVPNQLVGDPVRLRQLLMNLTGNAVKFTEEGEVILKLELLQRNDEFIRLLFSIKDSGIGIPEDKLATLFQPFTQADASTTRRFGGTGLGLHISQRIVDMMGGEIRVLSTVGIGSTFQFEVGFRYGSASMRQITVPELSTLKLAIVEDNIEVRNAIHRLMGLYVNSVHTFENGDKLLKKIQNIETPESMPDLILMDYYLPDYNADEIVKRLHGMGIINIPTAVITGKDEEEIMEKCQSAGITDIYTKPVTHSVALDILLNTWHRSSNRKSKPVHSIYPQMPKNLHQILLVEDNPINRDVATELLELEGYIVDTAVNGKEAVEMVFAEPPTHFSAILMDLQMPVLNGMDAVRKIRALDEFNDVPIIALSADVQDSVRSEVLQLGFNDFISKPIRPEEFFNTLGNWVSTETITSLVKNKAVSQALIFDALSRINTEEGLKHIGNNTLKYQKLLAQFRKEHAADIATIERHLKDGDMDSAKRTLHTLKGLAGTLGCVQLRQSAEAMEISLKQSSLDDSIIQLHLVQSELQSVIAELAIFDNTPEPANSELPTRPLPDEMKPTILSFIERLENNDLDAFGTMDNLRNSFMELLGSQLLREVDEGMERLDFQAAAAQLKKWMSHQDEV